MKGYSTKYALTTGIEEVEVTASESDSKYVYTSIHGGIGLQLRVGTTFFKVKEHAEEEARRLARRKVVTLKKQLELMQSMEKTPKWKR